MRLLAATYLANALATLPMACACSYPPRATVDEHTITKRDVLAGGKCGSQGNNAACAAGLCCSEEGVCGIGGYFCVSPGCQLDFGPACDGNQSPPGKDTSGVPRPRFGAVPYGVDVSKCTVPGKVALTFDDGPNKFTGELLDILKKNNVKATFFVVAANSGKGQIEDKTTGFPAIIKRMHDEGHQVGSHSWSHQDLRLINPQQRHDQIVKNEIALVDILGFFPTYLRPPFTKWNDDVLADLKKFGYHNLNFDLDTHDWEGDYQLARDSFSSAVSQHSPINSSFIAIAHDIEEKTVHGFVQYMIDQARKYNYELVTVGQCLGDPPNNWYRDPVTGQQLGGPPKQPQAVAVSSSAPTVATTTATTSSSIPATATGSGSRSPVSSSSTSPAAAAATPKPNVASRSISSSVGGIFLGSLVLLAWL